LGVGYKLGVPIGDKKYKNAILDKKFNTIREERLISQDLKMLACTRPCVIKAFLARNLYLYLIIKIRVL
jgi:hypothetical protein